MYEPLVEVDGEQVIRTSRAAQPDIPRSPNGSYYHACCFALRPTYP